MTEDPATEPDGERRAAARRRRLVIVAGHADRVDRARLGLADHSPEVQAAAVVALARSGALTVADVTWALGTGSTPLRRAAVESALARLGARRTFELPRISVLARDVGLSERALERRFAHHVGFTPVRFRRLARFRAALRAHAMTRQDWAQIALDTGFSDQAHLTRHFREFAGITPIEWALSQRAPAGFLQDGRLTAL